MKLEQVRKYALSLPEAAEQPHFDYTSFRVRGRIFASSSPPDQTHLHVFVDEDQRAPLIAAHPRCTSLLCGEKVVGVRVTVAQATPKAVNRLLLQSWKRKAPKRLAASCSEE
jgi:hypothetical protein